MDANFVIERDDVDILLLRYRRGARALVGLGTLAMGVLVMVAAVQEGAEDSLAWRTLLFALGGAVGLFGLNALVNNKTIRADHRRQEIKIEGRTALLWHRRLRISFQHISGVKVVKHFDEWTAPYWQLELDIASTFDGGRVLDASSDQGYIVRVAGSLSKMIGCPMEHTEFSRAAMQRKGD